MGRTFQVVFHKAEAAEEYCLFIKWAPIFPNKLDCMSYLTLRLGSSTAKWHVTFDSVQIAEHT